MTTPPLRWEIQDGAEVGAFFGGVAGVLSLVLVLGWGLISRMGRAPLDLRALLHVHSLYVPLYMLLGALIGMFWPLRAFLAGRILLWWLASAAVSLTIFSVGAGPVWRWSLPVWGKYALVSFAFAAMFAWPEGRKRGGT